MKKVNRVLNVIINLGLVFVIFFSIHYLVTTPSYFFNTFQDPAVALLVLLLLCAIVALISFSLSKNNTSDVIYVSKKEETVTEIQSKEEIQELFDAGKINGEIDHVLSANIADDKKIEKILSVLCNGFEAVQGVVYKAHVSDDSNSLRACASYAFAGNGAGVSFDFSDGLLGLSAREKRNIDLDELPEGYVQVYSGLGGSSPRNLKIIPVCHNEEVVGVVEMSFFKQIQKQQTKALQESLFKMSNLLS